MPGRRNIGTRQDAASTDDRPLLYGTKHQERFIRTSCDTSASCPPPRSLTSDRFLSDLRRSMLDVGCSTFAFLFRCRPSSGLRPPLRFPPSPVCRPSSDVRPL